jgi:hypothetical protein
MRKLLEACPACGCEMIVTQQSCTCCNTSVAGTIQPTIFSKMSPQSLNFIEAFVKNRGNVKEMERELGLSYWTIRNQLNDVIAELGFEAEQEDEAELQASLRRQEILAQVDAGDLNVSQAADLLAQSKE